MLPGGGVALIRSLDALANLKKELSEDPYNTDIALGVGIIESAIQEPLRTIAGNAGKDGSVVLHKVRTNADTNFGYNAATDTYGNMFDLQVLDPAKVVRTSLGGIFSGSHIADHRGCDCQQARA